jgi:hypothetical protein
MSLRPILLDGPSEALKSLMAWGAPGSEAVAILSLAVVAFIVGEILDASRDLLEGIWDRFQPMRWDFFGDAEKDEIEKIRTSYFTYYVFDCNISLALLVLLCSSIFFNLLGGGLEVSLSLIILLLFVWNARQLRVEIVSRAERWYQSRQNITQESSHD